MASRIDANLHHMGVFGRRTCGKTTLIIRFLGASWRKEGRYAVVLDPKMHEHNWGPRAYVTNDRAKWLAKWQHPQCRRCNIVWEETATTLDRDRSFLDVFTQKAGERGHRLIVSGHGYASLLPTMRDQITEIYLFRQSRNEAEKWAEQFAETRIAQACELSHDRREVLHVRMGGEPERFFMQR